ncbi:hypothetical protein RhiirA5_352294 [Rhizophagus irregularis]|uniref:Vacuolar ATPase assembly integral membrane protein VMA21 n=3 Tax=Rhizophagus irregularis TaxID=588596 RepID=A0A2I1EAA1_9GLOM|nr:hypothetical protein GLOIN_2v1677714 [Rhizophagus irregularis DAOM 181602=DAOM 197198]EXX71478.1 hypothetical protein RirG_078190 [Rhizophagus irregularis DAOM 197198w]PKC12935.1 hypothetical protein RhiirA5_352294 [Rhizophagus irregularis]RGB43968.1 hypothetical protein C1646_679581 [Rhizophagus diaphanus] [Rhizophagus sp. MUCL 43196]PKC67851.1 hypothetical protein RhiirA1_417605 [Rhizophagus irregularis]PKK75251.1 hypothetical protein RhiirC2_736989 [Rhizophagus irregularis]|eukprot:XP_025171067.1 hypothetical protein GLOIN_2v1677714 [Rhizophagus irregularis DAOM 181602=DAOM 197198]
MSSATTEKAVDYLVSQKTSVETPRGVLFKLYSHTIMMIILPLSTYYYTSNYYFEGENKTTYAALAAAGIANVVVFSFIITAIWEDYSSNTQQKRNKED